MIYVYFVNFNFYLNNIKLRFRNFCKFCRNKYWVEKFLIDMIIIVRRRKIRNVYYLLIGWCMGILWW